MRFGQEPDQWYDSFIVKITVVTAGSGTFAGFTVYDWIEQQVGSSAQYQNDTNSPQEGTYSTNGLAPLLEMNNQLVAVNSFQRIWFRCDLGGNPVYEFEADPVAFTVEIQNGSTSFTNITTLDLETVDGTGLTETNPSAGVAKIVIGDADGTHTGLVNKTTQSFAGAKTFLNFAAFNSSLSWSGDIKSQGGSDRLTWWDGAGGTGNVTASIDYGNVAAGKVGVYIYPLGGGAVEGGMQVIRATAPGDIERAWVNATHGFAAIGTLGVSGTDPSGNHFTFGIIDTIGSAGSTTIVVGTTPVTSGSDGGVLSVSGGKVSEVTGTSGQLGIWNGTTFTATTVSGDIAFTGAGVVTLTASALIEAAVFGF